MSAATRHMLVELVKEHPVIGGLIFVGVGLMILKTAFTQGKQMSLLQAGPTFEATVESIGQEDTGRGSSRYMASLTYTGSDNALHRCRMQVHKKIATDLGPGSHLAVKAAAESPDRCALATDLEGVFHIAGTPMSGLGFFGIGMSLFGLALAVFRERMVGG